MSALIVKVGRVECEKVTDYFFVSADRMTTVQGESFYPRWIAIRFVHTRPDMRPVSVQTEAYDTPQAAADALTEKLHALHAAIGEVL